MKIFKNLGNQVKNKTLFKGKHFTKSIPYLLKKEWTITEEAMLNHLNVVDPVESFVYMEIVTVKEILVSVNESIITIIKIL